ncbi:MAG: BtpA/SgcQ family protein [Erysipelotrichaceae bacterium]|nr:BtpA/SgcQ family protein [Erysipelotrichaceae bacterium]
MKMNRMERHLKAFNGVAKPMIGCLHMRGLPGTFAERDGFTMEDHIQKLLADAKALKEAGFDAFVFANEEDYPYTTNVGPEVVAAYTRIVTEVMREYPGTPFGVGIMMDAKASIAVAHATGAVFTRGYYANSYYSDFGIMNGSVGDVFRYAKHIGAEDLNIYTGIEGHYGEAMDPRPVEDKFKSVSFIIPVNGFIISGPITGEAPSVTTLASLKKIDPDIPLIMNSGATVENIAEMMPYCDGIIVGTSLKKDGYLFNPVDPERAKAFIAAANKSRNQ